MAYYAACNLFIMPNRQIDADIEGFGMVSLEAGAAGKPVIGGISGGTDDAIVHGMTGLRVDGTDAETSPAVSQARMSPFSIIVDRRTRFTASRSSWRRWPRLKQHTLRSSTLFRWPMSQERVDEVTAVNRGSVPKDQQTAGHLAP